MTNPLPTKKLLSSLVLGILCLVAVQTAHGQKNGLSYTQLDHLIKLPAPDSLVASQIRSRGISFTLTSKSLGEFSAAGAGPETIAALRERIRVGALLLQTEAGGHVLLDGKDAGVASSEGILVLKDISEGKHVLVAQKDGYRDGQISISLANNENKRLSLPLDWSGGFLSISTKPISALISVSGPNSFTGSANEVQCLPGNYTVTASLDGYITQNRSFTLTGGEHHIETFELAVDPTVLTQKLKDSEAKLRAGDADGAQELADVVLNQDPSNADAALVVAEAAFQRGDINRFVDAGAKAIRGGKAVSVPMMSLRLSFVTTIHRVILTISQSGISLASDPPESGSKMPGSLDFDLITNVGIQNDPRGFVAILIQYASKPHGMILHDLDFVPDGSAIGSRAAPGQMIGVKTIQVPNNAPRILGGIAELIAQARRR